MNASEAGFVTGGLPPPPPAASAAGSPPGSAAPVPPRPGPLPAPTPGVTKDGKGKPYDPEKHVPTLHPKTQAWLPRRRPASAPVGPSILAPDPKPVPVASFDGPAIGNQQVAAVNIVEHATCETIIGLLQTALVMIGEAEGILTEAEKEMLRRPLLRVLEKYSIGSDFLPAEVELAVCAVALVVERIKKGGKTATSFAKFRAWVGRVLWRREGASLGRTVAREVPADLVASLQAEIARLRDRIDAQPAPAPEPRDPSGIQPAA